MNVLLVEDDPVLARGLQVNLETAGYKVFWADSLKAAFDTNKKEQLSLVILDLGLGDGDGFEFLAKIRESGSRLPIIILSARSNEESVVEGLQLGANDYVKKPFGHKELLARMNAVLKVPQSKEEVIRFADLLLLMDQRVAKYKNQTIELNRREFDILSLMIQRAEAIVTRENLLQSIDKDGEIFDRTIDSHISHLRTRLRKSGIDSIKISSVYGVGYRLEKA